MWILVMFDLPTDTKRARRDYTLFRKSLLTDGFTQMQYSVYARHCPSKENTEVHLAQIERSPADGEVLVIIITDKQFERMHVFWGKTRTPPEKASCQLELV